jgi:ABC-type sugar transport system permease subunit
LPRPLARHGFVYLFVLPSVLLLLGFTVWPLLRTFWLSVQDVNLVRPGSEFVGLANFRTQLTDQTLFWPAVWHSQVWTVGSVGGEYLLGLGAAVLLNQPLRGRGLFRMLVLIPWTVPIVIAAMTWRWILQPEYGIGNVLLVRAGSWPSRSTGWATSRPPSAPRSSSTSGAASPSTPSRCWRRSRPSPKSCWRRRRSTAPAPGSASGGSPCRT